MYHEYTGHVTQRRRIIVVPFPRTRMDMLLMQLDQSVVRSGELRSPTSWDSPRGTMTLVLVAAPAGLAWSRTQDLAAHLLVVWVQASSETGFNLKARLSSLG